MKTELWMMLHLLNQEEQLQIYKQEQTWRPILYQIQLQSFQLEYLDTDPIPDPTTILPTRIFRC